MNLSINILALNMPEYAPLVQGNGSEKGIRKVRIASTACSASDDTLYIGTKAMYFPAEGTQEPPADPPGDDPMRSQSVHPGDAQVVCRSKDCYLFLDTTDRNQIMNRILDIFAHYADWEFEVKELQSYVCTLQDFVDKSRELLHYPILFIDQAQEIIAQTSMEEKGFSPIPTTDVETLVPFNQCYSDFRFKKELYYIPRGFFNTDGYNKNIFVNHKYYATVALRIYGKAEPGLLDLFEIFVSYLERWIQNSVSEREENQFFLLTTQILNHKAEAIPPMNRMLELNGWNRLDQKVCYLAKATQPVSQMDVYFCHVLSANIKEAFTCSYNENVLILANISCRTEQVLRQDLSYYFKISRYYCGASFPFTAMEDFYNAYLQAGFALERGEKCAGAFYDCKTFALDYMLQYTANASDVSMVHPLLARLREYDEKNNTDYYRTLSFYLQHERNHQKTAEALYIHRNTLFHRLNKIHEIWNPDLENPNERFYLLLSFHINEHTHEKGKQPREK